MRFNLYRSSDYYIFEGESPPPQVEIQSLDELIALSNREECKIILVRPDRFLLGNDLWSLEIYDGWRE